MRYLTCRVTYLMILNEQSGRFTMTVTVATLYLVADVDVGTAEAKREKAMFAAM
jgi:hypothetical protein